MAAHSSVLAWRIPGMAEPGGLRFMGSHRVGHDWSDLAAVAATCRVRETFSPHLYIDTLKNKMSKRQRDGRERSWERQTSCLVDKQMWHTALQLFFYSHYHDNLSTLKIYYLLVKGWTIFYKMNLFKRYKQILIHIGYLTYFLPFFFNVKIYLDICVVFILRHHLFFFLGWALSS